MPAAGAQLAQGCAYGDDQVHVFALQQVARALVTGEAVNATVLRMFFVNPGLSHRTGYKRGPGKFDKFLDLLTGGTRTVAYIEDEVIYLGQLLTQAVDRQVVTDFEIVD